MRIAYTVSSSYSGSTLLSFLLNAHPEVGTISEFDGRGDIARNPEFMCSCGVEIRSCPFFTELVETIRKRGFDFQVENLYHALRVHPDPHVDKWIAGRIPRVQHSWVEDVRDRIVSAVPKYRRAIEEFFAVNQALIATVLELQHASVFLDANKSPYRMRLLARRFDVRAVYMFKNGIAGVYSYVKNTATRDRPMNVEQASTRWFKEQIAISRSLRYLPGGAAIELSYAQLCDDTPGSLERIYRHIGVDPSLAGDPATAEHHIVGNRMRLKGPVVVRRDDAWREKLTDKDIDTYRRVFRSFEAELRAANPRLLEAIWR